MSSSKWLRLLAGCSEKGRVRPSPARLREIGREIDRIRAALQGIASQKLSRERTECEGCYEDGFDECVNTARAAMSVKETPK
jgi:type II secretory ATPase GspE/PulE/Tfp pilus assembly ATPase PilB-like protein